MVSDMMEPIYRFLNTKVSNIRGEGFAITDKLWNAIIFYIY